MICGVLFGLAPIWTDALGEPDRHVDRDDRRRIVHIKNSREALVEHKAHFLRAAYDLARDDPSARAAIDAGDPAAHAPFPIRPAFRP
jgi:hypothetical protein